MVQSMKSAMRTKKMLRTPDDLREGQAQNGDEETKNDEGNAVDKALFQ